MDPECVIIALLNDIPVGCVVAPAWDSSIGGIAFLGVHKEHRNKGIAAQLGATAIARLRSGNTSSICITALPVNIPEYRKQGFEQAGPGIQFWSYLGTQPSFNHNQQTEEMLEELPSALELATIDTQYTGIDRPRLWQCFIDQRARFLRIYCDSKLVAWTIFHSFDQKCTLAPLYAETPEQARALVQKAVRDLGERELVIEADATPNSEQLFAELGFPKSPITAVVSLSSVVLLHY